MPHRSKLRTIGLMAGLGVFLTGCQGWRIEQRPVPEVIQEHQSRKVAVTMNDLRWIVLSDLRVESDSIVGMQSSGTTFGSRCTALPLSGVRSVETRQFSLRKTVGLGVAIALLPFFYLAAFYEP